MIRKSVQPMAKVHVVIGLIPRPARKRLTKYCHQTPGIRRCSSFSIHTFLLY
ncbi:MAG: hypothetical protein IH613_11515 [Desulfuromonadales bacterium]|nr:hypothetical protein [Desulfuromonadales bacterium]